MSCVTPVEFRTLFGGFNGRADTVFPEMVLLDTLKFTVAYALMGVQLSSSITNLGTPLAGVFVVVGQDKPKLTVSNSIGSPICQYSAQNSIVGPPIVPIPTTKSGSAPFGSLGYPLPAGTPVSLYGFGDDTDGNFIHGIAQLYLVRANIR